LRIGSIGLVALNERSDELRGDQPDVVTEAAQLTAPVVRTSACLHCYDAWATVCEERHHFRTPQLQSLDLAGVWVHGVKLEDALGNV